MCVWVGENQLANFYLKIAGVLVGIEWNVQINLGKTDTLTILHLLVYKYTVSLHSGFSNL